MASDYGGKSSSNCLRPSLKNVEANFLKKNQKDRREVRFEPPYTLESLKNLRKQREEDLFKFHHAQEEISKALLSRFPAFEKQQYYQNLEDSSETSDQNSPSQRKSQKSTKEQIFTKTSNEPGRVIQESNSELNKYQEINAGPIRSNEKSNELDHHQFSTGDINERRSDRNSSKGIPEFANAINDEYHHSSSNRAISEHKTPANIENFEARRLELLTSLSGKSENIFNRDRVYAYSTRTIPGEKMIYDFEDSERASTVRQPSQKDFINKRETYDEEPYAELRKELIPPSDNKSCHSKASSKVAPQQLLKSAENIQVDKFSETERGARDALDKGEGHSRLGIQSYNHLSEVNEQGSRSKKTKSKNEEVSQVGSVREFHENRSNLEDSSIHNLKPEPYQKKIPRTEKPPLSESNFDSKGKYLAPTSEKDNKNNDALQAKRRNTTNFSQAPLPKDFNFLEELKKREPSGKKSLAVEVIPPAHESSGRKSPSINSPLVEKRKELEQLLDFKENVQRLTPTKIRGGDRKASYQQPKPKLDEDKSEVSFRSTNVDRKQRQPNIWEYSRELNIRDYKRELENWKDNVEHQPAELNFKEGYLSFMGMQQNERNPKTEQEEEIIRRVYEKNSHRSEEELVFQKNEKSYKKGEEEEGEGEEEVKEEEENIIRQQEGDSSEQKRKLDSDIEAINSITAHMKINSEPEINSPSRKNDRRYSNISHIKTEKPEVGRAVYTHKREGSGIKHDQEKETLSKSSNKSKDLNPLASEDQLKLFKDNGIPLAVSEMKSHLSTVSDNKVKESSIAPPDLPEKNTHMIIRIKDSSEDWRRSIKFHYDIKQNSSHPGLKGVDLKTEYAGSPREQHDETRSLRDIRASKNYDSDFLSTLIAQDKDRKKSKEKTLNDCFVKAESELAERNLVPTSPIGEHKKDKISPCSSEKSFKKDESTDHKINNPKSREELLMSQQSKDKLANEGSRRSSRKSLNPREELDVDNYMNASQTRKSEKGPEIQEAGPMNEGSIHSYRSNLSNNKSVRSKQSDNNSIGNKQNDKESIGYDNHSVGSEQNDNRSKQNDNRSIGSKLSDNKVIGSKLSDNKSIQSNNKGIEIKQNDNKSIGDDNNIFESMQNDYKSIENDNKSIRSKLSDNKGIGSKQMGDKNFGSSQVLDDNKSIRSNQSKQNIDDNRSMGSIQVPAEGRRPQNSQYSCSEKSFKHNQMPDDGKVLRSEQQPWKEKSSQSIAGQNDKKSQGSNHSLYDKKSFKDDIDNKSVRSNKSRREEEPYHEDNRSFGIFKGEEIGGSQGMIGSKDKEFPYRLVENDRFKETSDFREPNYEFLGESREQSNQKNQAFDEMPQGPHEIRNFPMSQELNDKEVYENSLRNSSKHSGEGKNSDRSVGSGRKSEGDESRLNREGSEQLIDEYQNKLKNELIMDMDLLEKRNLELQMMNNLKKFATEIFKHRFWELLDSLKELGVYHLQVKEADKFYAGKLIAKGIEGLKENFERNLKKRAIKQKLADHLEGQQRKKMESIYSGLFSICSAHKNWLKSVRDQLNSLKLGNVFKSWALEVYYKKSKKEMKIYRTGKLFDKWKDIATHEGDRKNNKAYSLFYLNSVKRHFKIWKFKIKEKIKVDAKFKKAKKSINLMKKRFFFSLIKRTLKKGRAKINFDDYEDFIPITVSIKDKVSKTTKPNTADTFISTTKAIDIKVLKAPLKK